MTRPLPRAHLLQSPLLRFLTENGMPVAAQPTDDVGQKLGDWLDFRQAIALHGVLHPESAAQPARHKPRLPARSVQALVQQVEQVRAQLEHSIQHAAPPGSGLARIDMPPPELQAPIEPQTAFEPYRRYHTAHQRQMDSTVRALRAQVRRALGSGTREMQQLAALDAAFENILAAREAALLSKVAKLLEKQFMQGLQAQRPHRAEASQRLAVGDGGLDDSVQPAPTAAWLMPWRQAMRSALLAELDMRLQPTLGLLEALQQETP